MRKLALAALGFSIAVILARYLLPYEWLLFAAGISIVLSFLGLLFSGNNRVRILIVLISLSIGFIWSYAYTAFFVKPYWELHEQAVTMEAVVIDYPVQREPRGYRVDVSVRQPGCASTGARLYYYSETELVPGDIISFTGKTYRTDISDDGERYDALSSNGIFLSVSVSEMELIGTKRDGLRYMPRKIAYAIAEQIDTMYPSDVSVFLKAFLVGERDDLYKDKALYGSLTASGIIHIVAISGMHISFLMGFVGLLIKNKRLLAFYGIPVLLVFMAMTGFTPAVTRAGIMQIFLIFAPIFKREGDSITSLSAALLLMLLINPYACASIGLQLSFASALGIILFTSRISNAAAEFMHSKRVNKNKAARAVINYITSGLSVTAGALILTLPLSVIHFGYISLISPITNLLTIGVVSITFPLGLLATLLGLIVPAAGSIAAVPVTWAVRYIVFIARLLSGVPYSVVYSSSMHIMCYLAYVYIMFIMLPLMKARFRQYIYPVCIAIIMLFAVILVPLLLPQTTDNAVTVLDVGQGLSVVASFEEHTMVVDCGSISTNKAGEITHEFLQSAGCVSVDLLVITHFHEDHVNGVEFLLSRINVEVMAIPDPEGSFVAEDIIDTARRGGTQILYVTETLSVNLGESVVFIYPPLGSGDENERGLTVLTMGAITALITGDMDSSSERALLRYADLPVLDVLVAGHHGSRYSTSEELLNALMPKIAVISSGRNSFGHPHPDTLARLSSYGATVYRTDELGHVTVR